MTPGCEKEEFLSPLKVVAVVVVVVAAVVARFVNVEFFPT
jgi:hypothetical protein